jgi:hypothetical protein
MRAAQIVEGIEIDDPGHDQSVRFGSKADLSS